MKIKTISDFFKEPVDKEIEDKVDAEIAVIDYYVAFAEWLGDNYEYKSNGIWRKYLTLTNYTTSQLFHKFTNEYEYRRLA